MNTRPATAGTHAPKPSAWAFAEDFIPESEAGLGARQAARELGVVPVSRGAAQALTFLAKVIDARAVVEIGTGSGVSSLALFAGMASDGVLTSIDSEAEHQNTAKKLVTETGIRPQRMRTIAGQALQVLPKLSDAAYDLVLVDGDPLEVQEYLEQAVRLLRVGGVVVVHHALNGGAVAEVANEADETIVMREALDAVAATSSLTPVLLPVGDGLLVAVKG